MYAFLWSSLTWREHAKITVMFEKVATIYECLRGCLDYVKQYTIKNRTLLQAKHHQWDTTINK